MSKKILWLDNDPSWVESYIGEIRNENYDVIQVTNVLEAESLIRTNQYDLIILDVMIPTMSEEEEKYYPPAITNFGHETGLVFYRNMREELNKKNIPVLVLTIASAEHVLDEFVNEGLPRENFSTKIGLRHVRTFISKINFIIGR